MSLRRRLMLIAGVALVALGVAIFIDAVSPAVKLQTVPSNIVFVNLTEAAPISQVPPVVIMNAGGPTNTSTTVCVVNPSIFGVGVSIVDLRGGYTRSYSMSPLSSVCFSTEPGPYVFYVITQAGAVSTFSGVVYISPVRERAALFPVLISNSSASFGAFWNYPQYVLGSGFGHGVVVISVGTAVPNATNDVYMLVLGTGCGYIGIDVNSSVGSAYVCAGGTYKLGVFAKPPYTSVAAYYVLGTASIGSRLYLVASAPVIKRYSFSVYPMVRGFGLTGSIPVEYSIDVAPRSNITAVVACVDAATGLATVGRALLKPGSGTLLANYTLGPAFGNTVYIHVLAGSPAYFTTYVPALPTAVDTSRTAQLERVDVSVPWLVKLATSNQPTFVAVTLKTYVLNIALISALVLVFLGIGFIIGALFAGRAVVV